MIQIDNIRYLCWTEAFPSIPHNESYILIDERYTEEQKKSNLKVRPFGELEPCYIFSNTQEMFDYQKVNDVDFWAEWIVADTKSFCKILHSIVDKTYYLCDQDLSYRDLLNAYFLDFYRKNYRGMNREDAISLYNELLYGEELLEESLNPYTFEHQLLCDPPDISEDIQDCFNRWREQQLGSIYYDLIKHYNGPYGSLGLFNGEVKDLINYELNDVNLTKVGVFLSWVTGMSHSEIPIEALKLDIEKADFHSLLKCDHGTTSHLAYFDYMDASRLCSLNVIRFLYGVGEFDNEING